MRIETSEINATRLDILSGPGTRQLVDGVRERLRSDKPRCIAIGCCANGASFRLMTPPVFALVDESDFMRYLEFNAGYAAFNQGRWPGRSRNSRLGWLKACHEDAQYLEERAEERRGQ